MLAPERFRSAFWPLPASCRIQVAFQHPDRLTERRAPSARTGRPCSRSRSAGRRSTATPATACRGMRAPHGMRTIDRNAVGSPSRAASMPKARAVSASAGWPSQPTAMQFARSSFARGISRPAIFSSSRIWLDVLGRLAALHGDQQVRGDLVDRGRIVLLHRALQHRFALGGIAQELRELRRARRVASVGSGAQACLDAGVVEARLAAARAGALHVFDLRVDHACNARGALLGLVLAPASRSALSGRRRAAERRRCTSAERARARCSRRCCPGLALLLSAATAASALPCRAPRSRRPGCVQPAHARDRP